MKISQLFLALTALLALAGCSKKEDGLRFRYWGDSAEIEIINETLRGFKKAHPEINVISERKPPDANYASLLVSEFAAGIAPDVIFLGDLGCDKLFEAKRFLPLNAFLAADSELKASDYYGLMIKRFSHAGNLYLLPRDIAPIACVYYNKNLFDQAKLAYPKDNWTWKEFKALAMRLTDPAASGGPRFGFGDDNPNVEPWVYSSGGTLVDSIDKPSRITLDSAKALRGIRFRMELLHTLKVIPSGADAVAFGQANEGLFMGGKLAMFYSGIWKTPTFRKIKDFDWDITRFPAGPDGNREVPIAGSGYGIASTTKDPQAAWKLVRYLAGHPGQKMLATTGLAQPAIKSLAASKVFLDGQKPLNKKMLLKVAELGYGNPPLGRWAEFYDGVWRPNIELIWVPGYKGDEAALVKKAVAEGNAMLFEKK